MSFFEFRILLAGLYYCNSRLARLYVHENKPADEDEEVFPV